MKQPGDHLIFLVLATLCGQAIGHGLEWTACIIIAALMKFRRRR